MNTKTKKEVKKSSFRGQHNGFALIATISIMVLLVLIALAMLSLSTITLRTESSNQVVDKARQNARMSLMMAIAQLQSLSGPDTRVTASSRLQSETNVAATGVWRSWEGIDRDGVGRPTVPNYNLKNITGDPSDEPSAAGSDGRFLGWLASTNVTPSTTDLSDFSKTANDDFILLLGDGSVDDTEDHVYMKPTYLSEENGAIAWWTSGNSQKATIKADRVETPDNTVAWQERVRSNGQADAEIFGLAEVNNLPAGSSIPTTNTLKLVDGSAEVRKFHDLTTFSRGLPVNVATGGWKKDISLLSEQYQSLPSSGLPSYTRAPGVGQTFTKSEDDGTVGNQPTDALLYPWGRYKTRWPFAFGQTPPICSWASLVDYARQYKVLSSTSASLTKMPPHTASSGQNDRFEFQEQVRRLPVLARLQWIYSLCSEQVNPAIPSQEYRVGIMVTPVVTFWNPYNVELDMTGISIKITGHGIAPLSFSFDVNGRILELTPLRKILDVGLSGADRGIDLDINSTVSLAPGATQIFSIASNNVLNGQDPNNAAASNKVNLTPGYTPGGGVRYYQVRHINQDSNQEVRAAAGDNFAIAGVGYGNEGSGSIGIWLDMTINGATHHQRMAYRDSELGGSDITELLYPSLTERASVTQIADISGNGLNTRAFASSVFGYRMATPVSSDMKHAHLLSKGMLQTNPLTYYAEVGNQDDEVTPTSMANSGVFHPINAPYDFAFQDVNGWNDTQFLPQFESGTNSSYIVSGLGAADGLTRCVMAELPTRPLQSLAQLQHWDARNNNPIPPFQFNIIGNGSAHPLFAPDQIEIPTLVNNGMVNDDTFILNHVLFDDWFVSSIAPDLVDFGTTENRDLETVYEEHVNGTQPLPNRFYLPANGADATSIASEQNSQTNLYTYETIASELEIDGAFNVNSVSLDAWRAILRHSRGNEVPYLTRNGATDSDSAATFPYPRTSIAGDQASSSGSLESNATNSSAVHFAGYKDLTEVQIDTLAEEIVSEIRKRGPFLSFSEFVNRQLTTDKDLALASTIQKALDNLSERGNSPENPYTEIQAIAPNITSVPPGNTDYKFPEAAFGSSAFGVPGWIRQADILTPLAPIMTVRDDSFTIRAYGDVRDTNDSSIILASAWCEATLQRQAEYNDPTDDKTIDPYGQATSDLNKRYGRKYKIVAFRWLNEGEI